jgi:cytochrome oxidase assembly protein ShyY1
MTRRSSKNREPQAFLKSLIAIALIALCLWAAQWQFQRGIDRHHRNANISAQVLLPPIDISAVTSHDISSLTANEWRTVTAKGRFNPAEQILLKNHYSEGIYGYEVLTRFKVDDGRYIWIDRGWVKAGKDAKTAPLTTPVPLSDVVITARVRLDRSLPVGAFFALPNSGTGMISKLNAQTGFKSEGFYLDLINGSDPTLTPAVPAELPELSDGPHLAYALQWLFFAGLIIYGRILIRRGQILTRKEL